MIRAIVYLVVATIVWPTLAYLVHSVVKPTLDSQRFGAAVSVALSLAWPVALPIVGLAAAAVLPRARRTRERVRTASLSATAATLS